MIRRAFTFLARSTKVTLPTLFLLINGDHLDRRNHEEATARWTQLGTASRLTLADMFVPLGVFDYPPVKVNDEVHPQGHPRGVTSHEPGATSCGIRATNHEPWNSGYPFLKFECYRSVSSILISNSREDTVAMELWTLTERLHCITAVSRICKIHSHVSENSISSTRVS